MALEILAQENVWLDKARYVDAERVFHEKSLKVNKNESFVICSRDSKSSEKMSISDLKSAIEKLGSVVSVLERTFSEEKSKEVGNLAEHKPLTDPCESKNLKIQNSEAPKTKSRKISQCENCSLCDQITKYHEFNDINKLLSSVEQWDINHENQYKYINNFECLICFFKTNKFIDWKLHIMSISHMADSHMIKDLYSYVCIKKECKVLLYGSKKSLTEHKAKHSEKISICGMPILMAEVMKRFITKQKSIYFCSHCKKFAETPIHSNSEQLKINKKSLIKYYCKYCRVDFYSTPYSIHFHSLSVEHMTLKCLDKLCTEAKMNSKKIKLSEQPNENDEKNFLPTVDKQNTSHNDYKNCKLCRTSVCWNSKSIELHLLNCKNKKTVIIKDNTTMRKFECNVCNYSSIKFKKFKKHVITFPHLTKCYDTNKYVSYFCNECKLLIYADECAINNHRRKIHRYTNTVKLPILSTLIANNFEELNKNLNRVETIHYYGSSKPEELSKKVSHYCNVCKIEFHTSIDDYNMHLITSEHIIMTLLLNMFDKEKIIPTSIPLPRIALIRFEKKGNDFCICKSCSDRVHWDSYNMVLHLLGCEYKYDLTGSNNTKVKTYECKVCDYFSDNICKHKMHSISHWHLTTCNDTSKYLSYFCNECNTLIYADEFAIHNHQRQIHNYTNTEELPILSTFIANNFEELNTNPNRVETIHYYGNSKPEELSKKVSHYCNVCKIEFHTSFDDYNMHLITSEHIIMQFFTPKLCYENANNFTLTNKTETLQPNVVKDISLFKNSDHKEVSNENNVQIISVNENLKKQNIEDIKMLKSKIRKVSQCENCSLCDKITKYHEFNDINKLLSSVEQWDISNRNQYKSINNFECLICFFKTNKFIDWKLHIMSISHMADSHMIKDLYSYICLNKKCKVLLYGSIKSLTEHTAKHSEKISICGMPILMAEVMKRFITKQKSIYFCSHCKKFAETPIHSNSEQLKINVKCPIQYYCKYCRVDFYSSPEMIDFHSLSAEHLTLKCLDKLCIEAKINSKKIKLSEQPNENDENNLLPTVDKQNTSHNDYTNCKLCNTLVCWDIKKITEHLLVCEYKKNFTIINYTTMITFQCKVCNCSYNKFDTYEKHIISFEHLSISIDTSKYYVSSKYFSYFCNVCNTLIYADKTTIDNHQQQIHNDTNTVELPILSTFMAKIINIIGVSPKHYYGNSKQHESSRNATHYCKACKIIFHTSILDYNMHLITSEHIIMTLLMDMFDKNENNLAATENIQTPNPNVQSIRSLFEDNEYSKEIKLTEPPNENKEMNLSPTMKNEIIVNSISLPMIVLIRFEKKSNEFCICKLCSATVHWDSNNIVLHLVACVYKYDLTGSNNTKIKTYVCKVCNYVSGGISKHIMHNISHWHLTNCNDTSKYLSYFCNECNTLIYADECAINNHQRQIHNYTNTIKLPILSTFIANNFQELNKNPNRVETIHYYGNSTPEELSKIVSHNCNVCKIDFHTSIDDYNMHLITSEHIILKFLTPKLCDGNANNCTTTNKMKTIQPNEDQNISLFTNSDNLKVANEYSMKIIQIFESTANVNAYSAVHLDQKSQNTPLNVCPQKCDTSVHASSSESFESIVLNSIRKNRYTQYFKHKMNMLNLHRQYKDNVMKTLAYYCNVCDFVTEEKCIWDNHIETKHSCATNRPIVNCSICSMMVVGESYEEHVRTIEHCILLKFALLLESIDHNLMKCMELVKLIDTSTSPTLDETFMDPKINAPLDLNKFDNTEAGILDCENSENNICILKNVESKDHLVITNTLPLDENTDQNKHKSDEATLSAIKSTPNETTSKHNNLCNVLPTATSCQQNEDENMKRKLNDVNVSTFIDDLDVLSPVESTIIPNKIIVGELQHNVASICSESISSLDNVTNVENEKSGKLDEDKAYGNYVTQRLEKIKNSNVKQDLRLKIDKLFNDTIEKIHEENA